MILFTKKRGATHVDWWVYVCNLFFIYIQPKVYISHLEQRNVFGRYCICTVMLIQSRISFDLHTDGKNLVDPCAVLHSALGKVGLSSRTWRNWWWLRPALEKHLSRGGTCSSDPNPPIIWYLTYVPGCYNTCNAFKIVNKLTGIY